MKKPFSASGPVTLREVLIPLGIGVLLFLGVMVTGGGFAAPDRESFWKTFCDAMTVPGVLLTGSGLLAVVTDQGAFDALRFGLRKIVDQVRREEKRNETPKTYYDYVEAQRSKKRGSPRMRLLIGGVFLLGAALSLAAYFSAGS